MLKHVETIEKSVFWHHSSFTTFTYFQQTADWDPLTFRNSQMSAVHDFYVSWWTVDDYLWGSSCDLNWGVSLKWGIPKNHRFQYQDIKNHWFGLGLMIIKGLFLYDLDWETPINNDLSKTIQLMTLDDLRVPPLSGKPQIVVTWICGWSSESSVIT